VKHKVYVLFVCKQQILTCDFSPTEVQLATIAGCDMAQVAVAEDTAVVVKSCVLGTDVDA